MRADFLDRYSRGTSLVHRWDARSKLLLALGLAVWAVATPLRWWPVHLLQGLIVLAAYAASRLPWTFLVGRLLALLPFLLLLAGAAPLFRGLESGWDIAAQMLARSLISLTAMLTLVATTPFSSLLAALARLHMPQVLLSILAFMYRYMFVLVDELERMRRAKLARTFYPSLSADFAILGHFAGVLFVRAFERAERIYAAMCARGWTGRLPAQDEQR
jgi:cobalt/nickel transport system permease protein